MICDDNYIVQSINKIEEGCVDSVNMFAKGY